MTVYENVYLARRHARPFPSRPKEQDQEQSQKHVGAKTESSRATTENEREPA